MQVYIGIDPGKGGGVAILDNEGEILEAFKLDRPNDFLVSEFRAIEKRYKNFSVVLEKVHASPPASRQHSRSGVFEMGVVQAFSFGKHVGLLHGILEACNLPYTLVDPRTWQGYMKCLTKGNKNITRDKAQRLFPQYKITHWSADALLIAEYCRRTHT